MSRHVAAGIVVGKVGTTVVSQDEVRTALQDQELACGGFLQSLARVVP